MKASFLETMFLPTLATVTIVNQLIKGWIDWEHSHLDENWYGVMESYQDL